ncbi:4736_t:CDS:2 [Cetraspora pellucida]|uniref:4736_t:CDS:1 n=1 Tax=Cetraspora pellucida TaxID=1433469 RepID=A0A9N8WLM2_9GLOM|nr:4736_t:CDS:2 [Cetraspora pellucida]
MTNQTRKLELHVIKDILRHQRNELQTHFNLFEILCDAGVDTLPCNDPLVNSLVDLGSPRFSLKEEEFMILPSDKVTHVHWVEQEYERERVARNITDDLLLKINRIFFRRVSDESENSLVEAIAHLIEASLCQLPLEYDVDVSRGEKQNIASKNQKYEVAYVENGKWDDQKISDDHNKLAKLGSYGYKKIVKGRLKEVYIAFGINIAGRPACLPG